MTSQENLFLSASIVKEIAMLGGYIDGMVPPHVASALKRKLEELDKRGEGEIRIISLGQD